MTNQTSLAFLASLSILAAGCGDELFDAGPAPSPSASSPSEIGDASRPPRLSVPHLGPDERRYFLVVLPGDASVEVDGRPAFRRHGLVELVGKVGDTRRVRVFKGALSTEEKIVTIRESGPFPALVDLAEALARAAGPATKKGKPLVFGDIDE